MAKKDRLDRRSGYYQTIGKFFIDLRGAPFFLSSKELAIISQWEEMDIPLRIVLEGIKESFERGEKGRETKILVEVEKFLEDIPEGLRTLRPIYLRLHTQLSGGKANEEDLDKAEETIERLIEESLSVEQVKTITAEILAEFGMNNGPKFDQIFRIKALKAKREKHKIPHVSPFYY
jgi:hypothetical protein